MVRNRKGAGRSKRPTKPRKTSSEAEPGHPASGDVPAAPPELRAAAGAPLGFPDKVYLLASVVFQNNHLEKPAAHRLVRYGKERGLALPDVKEDEMQRAAYELAFNTLKYQELLEDIMVDSGLYLTETVPDDQVGLLAVMLYDFQDRKFHPWEHQEEEALIQKVSSVKTSLLRWKTKLAASLARCRIKHNLLSIHCILPSSVKMKQERSRSLLVYAWVNTLKSSRDEVHSVLRCSGFSQVKSFDQLEGRTFCQDTHCRDVLVFPAQLKAQLCSTRLLRDHKLIIQDKACSLGPYALCSVLPDEGDVLMVGCFSGFTVSHTASLIAERHSSSGTNNKAVVYVCVSDRTTAEREELQQAVTAMGCKNVMLITEDFQCLSGGDKRLQEVRVILLTPKCSLSAVCNPVEFIVQEKGDTELLQDLSQGSVAQSKLEALVTQQTKDIDHALKFPKVLALVYSTCSSYPEENEGVISRALEQAKARCDQEGEPKQANFRPSGHQFSSPGHAGDSRKATPYFTLEPSEHNNGCFLAVLTRELAPDREAPQEVVARANAKGILDRISCTQPTKKQHHSRAQSMAKASHAHNSQTHLSLRSWTKSQGVLGSNSTTLCGHQEFTSRRQPSQGKPKALRFLGSDNTAPTPVSCSREGSTPSFPFKPENSSPTKSITPLFSTTIFTGTSLQPAPPSATPVARPRKARQEVLKPVVLVLPPVHFPDFLPPLYSRMGFSPRFSHGRWRSPSHTIPRSSHGLLNDFIVKSQSLS